jgi:hypothetical protein
MSFEAGVRFTILSKNYVAGRFVGEGSKSPLTSPA